MPDVIVAVQPLGVLDPGCVKDLAILIDHPVMRIDKINTLILVQDLNQLRNRSGGIIIVIRRPGQIFALGPGEPQVEARHRSAAARLTDIRNPRIFDALDIFRGIIPGGVIDSNLQMGIRLARTASPTA
jgi:hypothetical protein